MLKILVKGLRDKSDNVRFDSARKIGRLRTEEAFDTLAKVVWKTKDIEILRGALGELDGIGSFKDKKIPFYMEVVKRHKVPMARMLAAASIGSHGAYIENLAIQEQILEFLVNHSNDKKADVREGCIRGLSYMRNTEIKNFYPKVIENAFNVIQKARSDSDPKVRRVAGEKFNIIERLNNELKKN